MEKRYTPQKQNSGHHFIYLEDYNIQRQMNKQSGFNAEQIEKDNYRRVIFLKIKSKMMSYHSKQKLSD